MKKINRESTRIQIIIRSRNNVFYFSKYLKILNPDNGFVSFDLNNHQIQYLNKILNNSLIDFGIRQRQTGFTTATAVYILWKLLFTNETILYISEKFAASRYMVFLVKKLYQSLPEYLKIKKIIGDKKESILFEDYSGLVISSANSDYVTGCNYNTIVYEHWNKENLALKEQLLVLNHSLSNKLILANVREVI